MRHKTSSSEPFPTSVWLVGLQRLLISCQLRRASQSRRPAATGRRRKGAYRFLTIPV